MEDKKYITITDDDGNVLSYEIVLAFYWSKTNKYYVVYTDNTYKDNKLNLFASVYYPDDDTRLDKITTEEEWIEIESRLGDANG